MKIVSFNINGLNAFNNKGNLDKLISETNADIYCFQEIKISKAKEDMMKNIYAKFESYSSYNCICTAKNGYAGVSILVKNDLLSRIKNVTYPNILVEDDDYKNYGDGRIVVIKFDDFILINAYVVNSGNKEIIRVKFDIAIKNFIKNLNKPCIFCGDMNVCSTELDYWGDYSKAKNSSPGLFEFEINGFNNLIKECHLVDSYRLIHGPVRQYSWFSPYGSTNNVSAYDLRRGWRIDYFLISEELKEKIVNSIIYEGWNIKDHSPIEIEINI